MMLELYILFQLLVLVMLMIAYNNKEPLFSALAMLFSSFLAVGAWSISSGVKYVYDAAIGQQVAEILIYSTPYLAYLNMGLFGLALVFFYYDVFEILTGQSKGLGNLNLSRNNNNYK
jgi:hypothetical protein